MIQQITNNRSEKALTKKDFARITFASCLNFFHTNSMFSPWPFGLYYAVSYEWAKRVNSNSYQFQHCWGSTAGGTSASGISSSCNNIQTISYADVEAKDPDLICNNDGEERVCIECCYRKVGGNNSNISVKSKLGFFILEPITKKGIDNTTNNLFIYRVIITPKPGLFPGKN